MPSLLEALERKYFADTDGCQLCPGAAGADNNNSSSSNNDADDHNDEDGEVPQRPRCDSDNENGTPYRKSKSKSSAPLDVVVIAGGGGGEKLSSTPPSPYKRAISIFIPRVSPLICVPELLVLNDCDIDCAGDFDTIKDKCQRVRELDLAQNKLHDWGEVLHILEHMPRVEFLNLSKNHLNGPIAQFSVPTFNNLRGIVLNGTYLDWQCLDVLLENLPILEELHLSLNNYTEVLIDVAECGGATAASHCEHSLADNDDEQAPRGSRCCCCCCGAGTTTGNGSSDEGVGHDADAVSCAGCCQGGGTAAASPTTAARCRTISAHKSLKALHFTGNPIESWHEICRLGRVFPGLENLVLAECPIRAIHTKCLQQPTTGATPTTEEEESAKEQPAEGDQQTEDQAGELKEEPKSGIPVDEVAPSPAEVDNTTPADAAAADDDDCPHKNFLNLTVLNLSHAHINTWDDIDRLAQFPKLRNLRIKNLPLWDRLECTEHERRQLLIARLPNVCLLNGGGVISADEREDAERAFIRYYTEKPVTERPRRYDELLAKHGQLDPLVNINLKPDKRVKVILCYNDQRESRMVDVYRTVADLKVRLEKVVGMPAQKMRLYYLDKDFREFGPEEMKYPSKQLYSYNIQPGDEIIIDQKK